MGYIILFLILLLTLSSHSTTLTLRLRLSRPSLSHLLRDVTFDAIDFLTPLDIYHNQIANATSPRFYNQSEGSPSRFARCLASKSHTFLHAPCLRRPSVRGWRRGWDRRPRRWVPLYRKQWTRSLASTSCARALGRRAARKQSRGGCLPSWARWLDRSRGSTYGESGGHNASTPETGALGCGLIQGIPFSL
jgi:hypothetical protein